MRCARGVSRRRASCRGVRCPGGGSLPIARRAGHTRDVKGKHEFVLNRGITHISIPGLLRRGLLQSYYSKVRPMPILLVAKIHELVNFFDIRMALKIEGHSKSIPNGYERSYHTIAGCNSLAERYCILSSSLASRETDLVPADPCPQANASGRMNRAANVEAIRPPTTARPRGEDWSPASPSPLAIGIIPTTMAMAVIMIGRRRRAAASLADCRAFPLCCRNCSALVISRTALEMDTPTDMMIPI